MVREKEIKSFEALDFGYGISSVKQYLWQPEFVFTDGNNTYIRLPGKAAEKYKPTLFVFDGDAWQLCPYTVSGKNDLLVVEGQLQKAFLLVGKNKKVGINKLKE